MRPESGLPAYPRKRLIVFAAVNNQKAKLIAVENRKVEALMTSFTLMRPGKRGILNDASYFETLDRWPHYRYLDSGVFTFLSRAQDRTGVQTAVVEARKRMGDERKIVRFEEATDHAEAYARYLEQRLDRYDFVFECDLDPVEITRSDGVMMPGYEFTLQWRDRLRAIAGDRLIPVWHVESDDRSTLSKCAALLDEYRYISIGSTPLTDPILRRVCDMAHKKGALVHGLGTSKRSVLELIPFDTVDSSTWLSGGKFGMFGEFIYTDRREVSPLTIRRMRAFETKVRQLGYNPEDLKGEKPKAALQHEVAIAIAQERQDAVSPISRPLTRVDLGLV